MRATIGPSGSRWWRRRTDAAGCPSASGAAHAAEAEVVGSRTHLSLAPGPDHVAGAVLLGAKEGATAVHALGLARLCGIKAGRGAAGIAGHAAGERRVVVGSIPVADPFPDVTRHVVEAVTVGRELRHGSDAGVTVFAAVGPA